MSPAQLFWLFSSVERHCQTLVDLIRACILLHALWLVRQTLVRYFVTTTAVGRSCTFYPFLLMRKVSDTILFCHALSWCRLWLRNFGYAQKPVTVCPKSPFCPFTSAFTDVLFSVSWRASWLHCTLVSFFTPFQYAIEVMWIDVWNLFRWCRNWLTSCGKGSCGGL